jgi:hypothetical protein
MTLSIATLCIQCRHAECHYNYADCRDLYFVMLNVVMLSVLMMNVVILLVVTLNVIILSVMATCKTDYITLFINVI